MRELSSNAIIECSAQDLIARALNTPARAPVEAHAQKHGDSGDLYRHGLGDKNVSAWLGPATIVDVSDASHGQVTVKWQGRHNNVRLQDLRPHLVMLVLLAADIGTVSFGRDRALDMLRKTLVDIAKAYNR